jgi:hypothetical protein
MRRKSTRHATILVRKLTSSRARAELSYQNNERSHSPYIQKTMTIDRIHESKCIYYDHMQIQYAVLRVVDTSSNPQSVERDQEPSLPTSVFALLGSPSTIQHPTCSLGSVPKLLTVSWSCDSRFQTCGPVPEWSARKVKLAEDLGHAAL